MNKKASVCCIQYAKLTLRPGQPGLPPLGAPCVRLFPGDSAARSAPSAPSHVPPHAQSAARTAGFRAAAAHSCRRRSPESRGPRRSPQVAAGSGAAPGRRLARPRGARRGLGFPRGHRSHSRTGSQRGSGHRGRRPRSDGPGRLSHSRRGPCAGRTGGHGREGRPGTRCSPGRAASGAPSTSPLRAAAQPFPCRRAPGRGRHGRRGVPVPAGSLRFGLWRQVSAGGLRAPRNTTGSGGGRGERWIEPSAARPSSDGPGEGPGAEGGRGAIRVGLSCHRARNTKLYLAASAALLGPLSFGFALGYSSPVIPELGKISEPDLRLDSGRASWFGVRPGVMRYRYVLSLESTGQEGAAHTMGPVPPENEGKCRS